MRPARADDEGFVVGLAGRFAETSPSWRSFEEVRRGTEMQLRRAFRAPADGAAILIAEDANGVRAGFAYLVFHSDFFTGERHGHVSELAVCADGNGVGRSLMRSAEEYFRENGVRFVTLNVNEENVRGRRFYGSLGFVPNLRQFVKVL